MSNKVHPFIQIIPPSSRPGSNRNVINKGSSNNMSIKKVVDEIDMMVEQIENELVGIHNDSYDTISYKRRVMNNNNSGKSVVLYQKQVFQNESKHQYDNQYGIEDDDIQLSHQAVDADIGIAESINEQFVNMSKQLNEFKQRHNNANEKVREIETKLESFEDKIELLEDENLNLKQQLQGLAGNKELLLIGATKNKKKDNNNMNTNSKLQELHKRSEEMRKALLSDDNDVNISLDGLFQSKNIVATVYKWVDGYLPFRKSIRQIQAKFGSSVESYFLFSRFIFLHFCSLNIAVIIYTIFHIINLSKTQHIVSSFFNGEGNLPNFMVYSSYTVSERLEYSSLVVLLMIVSGLFLCINLLQVDRFVKHVDSIESGNDRPFSKAVLAVWDSSISTKMEVNDLCGSIGQIFLMLLSDNKSNGEKKSRSTLLAIYSKSITKKLENIQGIDFISNFLTSFLLTVINSGTPMILRHITAIEKWDLPQTELNFLLFRVYLSNTLNTLVVLFSYLLLIDPFLLGQHPILRSRLQLEFNGFQCRIDQAANGIFTLVISSFVIRSFSIFASPLSNYIQSYINKSEWIKPEFLVPESMVSKFSFIGFLFMSIPIAPLSLLFAPFYLFSSFYIEKYAILNYYSKPKRPWKSQKAELMFSFFYLATFIILGVSSIVYFLTTKTLPKSCDMQDNFIGLCTDEVDPSTNTCTIDSSNEYYSLIGGKNANYPASICNYACGPFIENSTSFSPFRNYIKNNIVLNIIWSLIFQYPYISWLLVLMLTLSIIMKENTLDVTQFGTYMKEQSYEAQIQSLEAEKKKQEKIILKLKSIDESNNTVTPR
eukprot:gene4315-6113_t